MALSPILENDGIKYNEISIFIKDTSKEYVIQGVIKHIIAP